MLQPPPSPRTRDAAHLTCREFGLRDELQDKHGKRVVKRGIGERQCASISDLEVKTSVAIVSLGVLDVDGGKVYSTHAADLLILGEVERQVPCATANIQNASCGGDTRKDNE